MSQGPLCPNLTQKVQKEVSQMANHNLSCVMLQGGLNVNLNHLKKHLRGDTHPGCPWLGSINANNMPQNEKSCTQMHKLYNQVYSICCLGPTDDWHTTCR